MRARSQRNRALSTRGSHHVFVDARKVTKHLSATVGVAVADGQRANAGEDGYLGYRYTTEHGLRKRIDVTLWNGTIETHAYASRHLMLDPIPHDGRVLAYSALAVLT